MDIQNERKDYNCCFEIRETEDKLSWQNKASKNKSKKATK